MCTANFKVVRQKTTDLCSRAPYGRSRPRFVACSEMAETRCKGLEWPTEPNLKDKHSQKLPKEPIHAVVSLLLVLTDLCDVNLQVFVCRILITL